MAIPKTRAAPGGGESVTMADVTSLLPLAGQLRDLANELYVAEQMRALGGDEKEVQRLVREMARVMKQIEWESK
jgi:hypothetical protein